MRILAFVICGILLGAAFAVLISRQHRRLSIPSSADEVTQLRHRVEALESRLSDAERAILDLEEGLAWAEACEAERYPGRSQQEQQAQGPSARSLALVAGPARPAPGSAHPRGVAERGNTPPPPAHSQNSPALPFSAIVRHRP